MIFEEKKIMILIQALCKIVIHFPYCQLYISVLLLLKNMLNVVLLFLLLTISRVCLFMVNVLRLAYNIKSINVAFSYCDFISYARKSFQCLFIIQPRRKNLLVLFLFMILVYVKPGSLLFKSIRILYL